MSKCLVYTFEIKEIAVQTFEIIEYEVAKNMICNSKPKFCAKPQAEHTYLRFFVEGYLSIRVFTL